jgi:hypothetical protein
VLDYRVKPEEFHAWSARYGRFVPEPEPSKLPADIAEISDGLRAEKLLEYYISAMAGNLGKGMRVADLGSADSGFLDMATQAYGCEGWAVDPALAGTKKPEHPMIHHVPKVISDGGDELPRLSLITLHCSFEMFSPREMNSVFELARRKLLPGGRLVIVPLYLSTKRTIYSDASGEVPVPDDPGNTCVIGVRDYWAVPWSEWHSPETLLTRLIRPHGELSTSIHRVSNPHDVHPGCFLRFFGVWQNMGEGHG